jgi:hypothetical protein
MRNRIALLAFAAVVALCAAAAARAAGVTVNATVTGGSTLAVSSLNTPSFPVTLNGDDQTATYQAQLQIVDARGLATGGGWNLSITSTQYSDGAGHTLPANASTVTGVTAGCHSATSTCALPTNSASNSNVALPVSPTTTKILNAATGTGLGRIDVNVNASVAVPANTIAATYTSTLTFAIAAGP